MMALSIPADMANARKFRLIALRKGIPKDILDSPDVVSTVGYFSLIRRIASINTIMLSCTADTAITRGSIKIRSGVIPKPAAFSMSEKAIAAFFSAV